jgi:ring-1,2-phenylacetyl-CoA epoxidase subunit PaaD
VVSEAGIQVGIARTRAGSAARTSSPGAEADTVRALLADVPDPELPMLSVVDLGIVHRIDVGAGDGPITIEILPTFVGCPALELIKASIAEKVGTLGRPVEVVATFAVPWTTDRISAAGREALAAAGIAPPAPDPAPAPALIALEPRVPCPYCGSRDTVLDNTFGPTQCRTIRFCRGCRQPFEAIKPV